MNLLAEIFLCRIVNTFIYLIVKNFCINLDIQKNSLGDDDDDSEDDEEQMTQGGDDKKEKPHWRTR